MRSFCPMNINAVVGTSKSLFHYLVRLKPSEVSELSDVHKNHRKVEPFNRKASLLTYVAKAHARSRCFRQSKHHSASPYLCTALPKERNGLKVAAPSPRNSWLSSRQSGLSNARQSGSDVSRNFRKCCLPFRPQIFLNWRPR